MLHFIQLTQNIYSCLTG